MLIDGKLYKILNIEDLNSLVSLSVWLKDSLSLYSDDKKIPKNHLISFLEHLRRKAEEQRVDNKTEWFNELDQMLERVKASE